MKIFVSEMLHGSPIAAQRILGLWKVRPLARGDLLDLTVVFIVGV